MSGHDIADLRKSTSELLELGYDVYQIAGLINLIHQEASVSVHSPHAFVEDGVLYANGHVLA